MTLYEAEIQAIMNGLVNSMGDLLRNGFNDTAHHIGTAMKSLVVEVYRKGRQDVLDEELSREGNT
jgi:hypothetical protein